MVFFAVSFAYRVEPVKSMHVRDGMRYPAPQARVFTQYPERKPMTSLATLTTLNCRTQRRGGRTVSSRGLSSVLSAGASVCLGLGSAYAEAPASTSVSTQASTAVSPQASTAVSPQASSASRPWYDRVTLHGYADVYYGYNINRPPDGANFMAGIGTTGKRANNLTLNLAAIDVSADLDPVSVRVVLQHGTGSEVVYSAEPHGPASGPEVWKFLQIASIAYKAPLGRGLLIEAGILPSHVGFEVFPSKDNWNYTRGWNGELSPYYQAGIKLSYSFTDNLSAQIHVLNGWQQVGDNNDAKTIGAQLAWNSARFTAALNGLFGPELPADNTHWRLFGDLLLGLQPVSWLSLMTSIDIGYQQLPGVADGPDGAALWWAAYAWARAQIRPFLAVAVRGGYFDDRDGYMTGTVQTLGEFTGTVEIRLQNSYILKLESRYDRSTAPVFVSSDRQLDGTPVLQPHQGLLMIGAVASF